MIRMTEREREKNFSFMFIEELAVLRPKEVEIISMRVLITPDHINYV